MNKTIIIFIIVILVLIGGGVYVYNQPKDAMMKKEDGNVMMKKDDTAASNYVAYSKEALGEAADNRRVLFFYANWCPTCRPANESFNANADQIPEGVTVIRVNYNDNETDNEEKDLAKKYGITYQHTFVQIDQQGNQVTKWNGGQIDELVSNIK